MPVVQGYHDVLKLTSKLRFDAAKARLFDQTLLLRTLTRYDLQIFFGCITLQLVLAGWLSEHPIENGFMRVGLAAVDVSMLAVASALLLSNRRRRDEVVATVRNCCQALGFDDDGVYGIEGPLSGPRPVYRPWFPWFMRGIVVSFVGVLLILVSSGRRSGAQPDGTIDPSSSTTQSGAPTAPAANNLASHDWFPWWDIVESGAVTLAAICALLGINAWRRELVGKRQYELAEEVLASFYEARDLIAYIRSPVGHEGEGSTRKGDDRETAEQKRVRDRAYRVYERHNNRPQVFDRVFALRYRFWAIFGEDAKKPFEELRQVRFDIFHNADMLGGWLWDEINPEQRKQNLETRRKAEAVIWSGISKPDEIADRVDSAVKRMEAICSPIINRAVSRRARWLW